MLNRHRRSRLFSYPLPVPQNTLYQRLGISPESTTGEIRDAKSKSIEKLSKKKKLIDTQLGAVYTQVQGLQQTYNEIETLHTQGQDVNLGTLREKEEALSELEGKALAINPDYKQLLKLSKELQNKINDINLINLENPVERLKYDQETPPCAIMKLERKNAEVFTEEGRRLALILLRNDLVEFLEEKGENCYHPSDLTRKDFKSDFTYNKLLDG